MKRWPWHAIRSGLAFSVGAVMFGFAAHRSGALTEAALSGAFGASLVWVILIALLDP